MRTVLISVLAGGLVLALCGCPAGVAPTVFKGKKGSQVSPQYMFGDVGIDGDNWNITALPSSRIAKLKIFGNGNTVTVSEGVTLMEINMIGVNNVISVPEDQRIIRITNWGSNNQIVRRPATVPEYTPYVPYTPLPALPGDEGLEAAPGAPAGTGTRTNPVAPPPTGGALRTPANEMPGGGGDNEGGEPGDLK